MHPITFQCKAIHLAIVALGKKTFLDKGLTHMTPARFDFFYALLVDDKPSRLQQDIREELKLSGATVSAMVKRLKELGLISIKRCPRDQRRNVLRVTDLGRDLYNRAWETLCNERVIADVVRKIYPPAPGQTPRLRVHLVWDRLFAVGSSFRKAWQGAVDYWHEWRPSLLYDFEDSLDDEPLV